MGWKYHKMSAVSWCFLTFSIPIFQLPMQHPNGASRDLRLYQLDCQRRMPVWHPCRRVFTANRWKKTCFHFRGFLLALFFWTSKACQHWYFWYLRPTKCFVAVVACGTLWGQQPSSTSKNLLRILGIVWLSFLESWHTLSPFLGGGRVFWVHELAVWCPFQLFQTVRRVIELIRSGWENRISLPWVLPLMYF